MAWTKAGLWRRVHAAWSLLGRSSAPTGLALKQSVLRAYGWRSRLSPRVRTCLPAGTARQKGASGTAGGRECRAVAGIVVGSRRGAGDARVMCGSGQSQPDRLPCRSTWVHPDRVFTTGPPQWTHGTGVTTPTTTGHRWRAVRPRSPPTPTVGPRLVRLAWHGVAVACRPVCPQERGRPARTGHCLALRGRTAAVRASR